MNAGNGEKIACRNVDRDLQRTNGSDAGVQLRFWVSYHARMVRRTIPGTNGAHNAWLNLS